MLGVVGNGGEIFFFLMLPLEELYNFVVNDVCKSCMCVVNDVNVLRRAVSAERHVRLAMLESRLRHVDHNLCGCLPLHLVDRCRKC